jgi:hypothetical protein
LPFEEFLRLAPVYNNKASIRAGGLEGMHVEGRSPAGATGGALGLFVEVDG